METEEASVNSVADMMVQIGGICYHIGFKKSCKYLGTASITSKENMDTFNVTSEFIFKSSFQAFKEVCNPKFNSFMEQLV